MAIYWIGPGVFLYQGKSYKVGDELPKLSDSTVKSLIGKGKASADIPRIQAPRDMSKEILELKKALSDMEELCQAEREAGDQARAELEEAKATIQALTEVPNKKAAGPKK